ncbi:DUF397 domain-containing protein [Actinomadura sp. K4S16]|uniref:DUF397 domain-containing protein n=1 Tax=Actinomadura sp. K4S16 TaxID=1316147 RepID=UPI0011EE0951|nr:DUF397 domain-containing protein [Actinomadura sp. K4S16]
MRRPDLAGADWRKSSRSGSQGADCVQIASIERAVAVRDSKDPDGPVLTFTLDAWSSLLDRLKIRGV